MPEIEMKKPQIKLKKLIIKFVKQKNCNFFTNLTFPDAIINS